MNEVGCPVEYNTQWCFVCREGNRQANWVLLSVWHTQSKNLIFNPFHSIMSVFFTQEHPTLVVGCPVKYNTRSFAFAFREGNRRVSGCSL